jgi:molybdopterin synthase sulfur carrier subunit
MIWYTWADDLGGSDMQLRAYVTLRDLLGGSRFEWTPFAGATVRDALVWLAADCPEFGRKLWDDAGKLTGYVQVFVNGRAVQYLDGLDTPVADSDTVSLFPPVAGGSSGPMFGPGRICGKKENTAP